MICQFTIQRESIEVFWNFVFQLQLTDNDLRYKLLSVLIKCVLVLEQTNAESECSLSVSARLVAQERASLGEKQLLAFISLKMLQAL